MSSTSPVWSLENVFDEVICLQHLFLVVDRHGEQPVNFGFLLEMIFLPLERCVWPIRFLRFLFLL